MQTLFDLVEFIRHDLNLPHPCKEFIVLHEHNLHIPKQPIRFHPILDLQCPHVRVPPQLLQQLVHHSTHYIHALDNHSHTDQVFQLEHPGVWTWGDVFCLHFGMCPFLPFQWTLDELGQMVIFSPYFGTCVDLCAVEWVDQWLDDALAFRVEVLALNKGKIEFLEWNPFKHIVLTGKITVFEWIYLIVFFDSEYVLLYIRNWIHLFTRVFI